jgi:predicted DNA-binding transcriptional regulator AlpA
MARIATAEQNPLPTGCMPRGLSRVQASAYIGVSPTLFDRMVKDGRMPRATRMDGRVVWDVWKLDAAFTALDTDDEPDNPWARMSA